MVGQVSLAVLEQGRLGSSLARSVRVATASGCGQVDHQYLVAFSCCRILSPCCTCSSMHVNKVGLPPRTSFLFIEPASTHFCRAGNTLVTG